MNEPQIVESLRDILRYVGDDPEREGLVGTPERMLRSWKEIFAGYNQDVGSILSVDFDVGYSQMITLKEIPFFSTCEHHFLPFMGHAKVAYIPDGRVVGISKIARAVECFARRLQIQERMTNQIADALMEHLKPLGVGVLIEATHLCMVSRGIKKPGTIMRTTAIRGMMFEAAAREEFMR